MNRKGITRNPITRERPILLGFVVQRKGIDGRMEISIRWGRLIGTCVLLAILGWFAVAGALYFHFKYNKEFDQASYAKMLTLLPFGLDAHREEIGNYHIERGLSEFKEGNQGGAFRLLRLGVARAPANLEGRHLLAQYYEFSFKRPDVAADQLLKGIEQGGIQDLDYLQKTLRVLFRYQMDEEIQNLADKYLPEEPELTDINLRLALFAASANYLRGNYDRADDYITNYKLLELPEGFLLSANISWDRGNKIAAINKIEDNIHKFPNSDPLLMQLSLYYRELGEIDKSRRYAILRNVSDPLSAGPRIELLYIYNKSKDFEREQRETQRMLQQFREDEPALKSLAQFAANTGNIDLARRTYEEALENEFGIDTFALLLIDAHLVDKDYQEALNFSEELLKERPDWLTSRWPIFNSLRAVASYGINRPDLGEIYLQDYIDGANNQVQNYLAVSRRFTNIDRYQQARKILTIAYQKDPTNQKILSELIRTELSLGNTENLNRLLSRLLQMRRPQIDLLTDAYTKLGSDRFIFTPNRQSLLLQLSTILRENS
jgi:Tfp pilus assembly protein PilF